MKISRRSWLVGGCAVSSVNRRLVNPAPREEKEKADSLVGADKEKLPTPALLLDLNLLEDNIQKMSLHTRGAGIGLRPHAKTHKCPEIAHRQIEAGALGVCVATIFEAEAMARANVRGLLITSEMVGRPKIERLIRLTRLQAETMSVVDNISEATQLSQAAETAKVPLNVLIDVDPGGRRTGTEPGQNAVSLAERVTKLPGLRLKGIHSYSGGSAHVEGFEARREHSLKAMEKPVETFLKLRRAGLPMQILSGGSTGTYNIDVDLETMTELQTGSYVFMDVEYQRIGGKGTAVYQDFAPSLTVLSTVISKNHSDRATLDAGIKAFATDRRFGPEIIGVEGVAYRFGGDEHGILILEEPSREIRVGDRFEFIIPHCDPTVNLYDHIYCMRGNKVEAVWKTVGRGYV